MLARLEHRENVQATYIICGSIALGSSAADADEGGCWECFVLGFGALVVSATAVEKGRWSRVGCDCSWSAVVLYNELHAQALVPVTY